ncbi:MULTISPECIES: hypothetical protein [unclassified Pseudomonas]|uniref:hypothetical protein n=1 Tax=unclassified Pseudomonas TaxID=196821 RepID=UPI0021157165|nr:MULTISPECIES: hypothetical protein [unclassified Pseudomonas]
MQDCIVCFPEASGLEPLYLSFVPPVPGYLHIEGVGKAAGADFLLRASQPEGVAIPSAIADPLRGRAYATPAAVERAIWRTLGDIPELAQAFEPPNRARLALGLAPYAPRATWMGGRHHFELRIAQPSTAGSFDLDHLRMAAPSSEWGARHRQPMLLPWPISSGSRTWTPLVPPGSELLGPSELPAQPGEQAVYPGMEVKPGETVNTSLPAVEPGQAGASIPGFGEDDDLPESGLVFAGPPVVLGEVGDGVPMQQRSKGDGLQIDHMPSKAALRLNLLARQFRLTGQELNKAVINGASIAIPDIVHQSLSETYGGRNRKQKYIDSLDLRKAVDSNFNAIKPGLLEHGLSEAQAEQARAELHNLNIEKGWYE